MHCALAHSLPATILGPGGGGGCLHLLICSFRPFAFPSISLGEGGLLLLFSSSSSPLSTTYRWAFHWDFLPLQPYPLPTMSPCWGGGFCHPLFLLLPPACFGRWGGMPTMPPTCTQVPSLTPTLSLPALWDFTTYLGGGPGVIPPHACPCLGGHSMPAFLCTHIACLPLLPILHLHVPRSTPSLSLYQIVMHTFCPSFLEYTMYMA